MLQFCGRRRARAGKRRHRKRLTGVPTSPKLPRRARGAWCTLLRRPRLGALALRGPARPLGTLLQRSQRLAGRRLSLQQELASVFVIPQPRGGRLAAPSGSLARAVACSGHSGRRLRRPAQVRETPRATGLSAWFGATFGPGANKEQRDEPWRATEGRSGRSNRAERCSSAMATAVAAPPPPQRGGIMQKKKA